MPEMTATTVRYLFASEWASPQDEAGRTIEVPGARVGAWVTASNLLNLALWNLRTSKLVAIEQVRPYEAETAGGRGLSFTRFTLLAHEAVMPGLEGALLEAGRRLVNPDGIDKVGRAIFDRYATKDPNGVRGLILALKFDQREAFDTFFKPCIAEAEQAGVLEFKRSLRHPIGRPVIVDHEAIEQLRKRDGEINAARQAYRAAETDLDHAVLADCLKAVYFGVVAS